MDANKKNSVYSCIPSDDNLNFWIQNNLNVLFYGRHGVGKTSIITNAFQRHNLKYQVFSASTMDPWVDFIGVPKENRDANGPYLELVKPKAFRDNQIEALFFDELNRSHKKIRNAIMELIQFKSINGHKFPNLRFIWGAVNPSDDEEAKYDVEELDAAQADRFHVHVEIPNKPYAPYLRAKYGREKTDAAIDWWQEQPIRVRNQISPRRLEYAIQVFDMGGNLDFILPQSSNISQLKYNLANGSPIREYEKLIKNNSVNELKKWLEDVNNYDAVKNLIKDKPQEALHLLFEENIISLISDNFMVRHYVFGNYPLFESLIGNLAENSKNQDLRKDAIKCRANNGYVNNDDIKNITLPASDKQLKILAEMSTTYLWNEFPNLVYKKTKTSNLHMELSACLSYALCDFDSTQQKTKILNSICRIVEKKWDDLKVEEVKQCLKLIDCLASRTQSTTIRIKVPNIAPCINKCVKILRSRGLLNEVKDLLSEYKHLSYKLFCNNVVENCIVNKYLLSR